MKPIVITAMACGATAIACAALLRFEHASVQQRYQLYSIDETSSEAIAMGSVDVGAAGSL